MSESPGKTQPGSLYTAAREIEECLESAGWPFCIVGGVSVLRWGEPRQTTDVDFCLYCGWERTEEAIDFLASRYSTRGTNAAAFALRNRVLLLTSAIEGVTFDVSLGAIPFEESMVQRRSAFEFRPGLSLTTCSAEDLVVMKCFAGRPIDFKDVEGVLARNAGKLDIEYIRRWLTDFAEVVERTDPLGTFETLLKEIHKRRGRR